MWKFLAPIAILLIPCGLAAQEAIHAPQNMELTHGWSLASAADTTASGSEISTAKFQAAGWHPIHHMPATVLEILEEDGVYPNLYFGTNLLKEVPQKLL